MFDIRMLGPDWRTAARAAVAHIARNACALRLLCHKDATVTNLPTKGELNSWFSKKMQHFLPKFTLITPARNQTNAKPFGGIFVDVFVGSWATGASLQRYVGDMWTGTI